MPSHPASNASRAVLWSNPAGPALSDAAIRAARQVVGDGAAIDILAPGVAVALATGGDRPATVVERELRTALQGHAIDLAVRPTLEPARLFLADMDSTMIEQECIDELADYAGLKPKVAAITERAMRGEIAFEPALRERVALLEGLPVEIVDEIVATRLTLTPGGRTLIATMKRAGTYCCLVSGGFTLFTGRIAAMLGFDEHRANELVVENGRLTGRVREPILGKEAKLATLIELRDKYGLTPDRTLAVGDGANDLAMLGEAGLGVAFRAKPAVAAAAHARVDHGDLTALLYMQGYRQADFVERHA